jgi:hypothetical protein
MKSGYLLPCERGHGGKWREKQQEEVIVGKRYADNTYLSSVA